MDCISLDNIQLGLQCTTAKKGAGRVGRQKTIRRCALDHDLRLVSLGAQDTLFYCGAVAGFNFEILATCVKRASLDVLSVAVATSSLLHVEACSICLS